MPKEQEKTNCTPEENSLRAPFIIYTDLECLLKKVRSCQYNPENSYTEQKVKHKTSGYAWCSLCSFDKTKKKPYFFRKKGYIEKFCKDLKKLGTKIIKC